MNGESTSSAGMNLRDAGRSRQSGKLGGIAASLMHKTHVQKIQALTSPSSHFAWGVRVTLRGHCSSRIPTNTGLSTSGPQQALRGHFILRHNKRWTLPGLGTHQSTPATLKPLKESSNQPERPKNQSGKPPHVLVQYVSHSLSMSARQRNGSS